MRAGQDLELNIWWYSQCNWTLNGTFELPSSFLISLSVSGAGAWIPVFVPKSHWMVTLMQAYWDKHWGVTTNEIGLDPCFINTEKTWNYVIAAVPVVISYFRQWLRLFFMFICLQVNELAQRHIDVFRRGWLKAKTRLHINIIYQVINWGAFLGVYMIPTEN